MYYTPRTSSVQYKKIAIQIQTEQTIDERKMLCFHLAFKWDMLSLDTMFWIKTVDGVILDQFIKIWLLFWSSEIQCLFYHSITSLFFDRASSYCPGKLLHSRNIYEICIAYYRWLIVVSDNLKKHLQSLFTYSHFLRSYRIRVIYKVQLCDFLLKLEYSNDV